MEKAAKSLFKLTVAVNLRIYV